MENWITEAIISGLVGVVGAILSYLGATYKNRASLDARDRELELDREKQSQRLTDAILEMNRHQQAEIEKYRQEQAQKDEKHAVAIAFRDQVIQERERELKAQLEASALERDKVAQERKESQETFQAMTKQVQMYEAAAAAAQQESAALRQEVAEFNQRVNGLNVLLGELTGDLKKIREERDALKKDLEKAQGQIEHLEKLLIEKNNEIKELQDKVTSLELQRALEEPTAKETASEPAPTSTSAVESASAEPATIPTADDGSNGAAA